MMNDVRKNGLLVVVGIAVAFVLLELGLRLAGWVYMGMRETRHQEALKNDKAVRILCLGESTTALGGDHAYPRLLEGLLNGDEQGRQYSVINKGVPGITTDEILAHLNMTLDAYQPHLVVAMMGINDDDDEELGWHDRIAGQSKVVQLVLLIGRHVAERFPQTELAQEKLMYETFLKGWEQAIDGDGSMAEQMFLDRLTQHPEDPESYVELASWYTFNGEYSQALTILAEAEKRFDKNTEIRLAQGTVYLVQNRWVDASEVYYEIVQTTEYNDDAYMGLAWSFMRQGKYDAAEEILLQNIRINPRDVSYGALILCYQKQGKRNMVEKYRQEMERKRIRQMLPMTQENYHRLHDVLQGRGIPLVVVQYPRRNAQLLRDLFAAESAVTVVDNQRLYDEAVDRDGYDTYFINNFAGDFGHGTEAGNRLLAENVAKSVLGLVRAF